MFGNPFDVIYQILFQFSTWVNVFTTLVFFDWPIVGSIFNIVFNPISFVTVFGLVIAKKVVPLT